MFVAALLVVPRRFAFVVARAAGRGLKVGVGLDLVREVDQVLHQLSGVARHTTDWSAHKGLKAKGHPFRGISESYDGLVPGGVYGSGKGRKLSSGLRWQFSDVFHGAAHWVRPATAAPRVRRGSRGVATRQ